MKRPRIFRFSLGTLMVVVTVLCVLLGWKVRQAESQKEAVAWVREMGGEVLYDYEFDEGGYYINDAQPPSPDWLCELVGVDYFAAVIGVSLFDNEFGDLSPLTNLTNLENLYLGGTNVTDLSPLAKLTNLVSLHLDNTSATDLYPLADLTKLEGLSLADTPVTDLSPLAKISKLKALSAKVTQVAELAPLARLKNLEWLWLEDTSVTSLSPLESLTKLKELHLAGTPVTEEQITNLQKALPNCNITY